MRQNSAYVPPSANLVARFNAQISSSITIGTGVSAWADQYGSGTTISQATGGQQPTYSGSGITSIVTFDGVNDYLKGTFTLNQPETIYIVCKQITWTLNRYLFDGGSIDKMDLYQETSTPQIALYAGATTGLNSGLTLNTVKVVVCVFNTTSSGLNVNNHITSTGNAGSANAGGFTLGAAGNGSGQYSNIGVQDVLIYNVAHSTATQDAIIAGLRSYWSI